jgi:Leucine-rich repeat (LRR) protein
VSGNRLKSLKGAEELSSIEELWMSYNLVEAFDQLQVHPLA